MPSGPRGDCVVMRGAVLGVMLMSVMVEGVAMTSKHRDRGMGRRDISFDQQGVGLEFA